MSSGATSSAGRVKKLWGRAGKSLVMGVLAMGVACRSLFILLTSSCG